MNSPREVAALFVEENGVYAGLDGVDLWPSTRDARQYGGPHPVVAHPPCKRWGRFWRGSVRHGSPRHTLGDDEGCFASALASVRRWGGVLEHPAYSHAWKTFGLKQPNAHSGWIIADTHGGYTCQVWQGHYGNRTAKATWLYALGTPLPRLILGKITKRHSISNLLYFRPSMRLFDDVPHVRAKPQVPKRERAATPTPFRDVLLSMARATDPQRRPPRFSFLEEIE